MAERVNESSRAGVSGRCAKILRHCRSISFLEFEQYIHELGVQHDFVALSAIYTSDHPAGNLAAGVAAANMDSDRVVSFCRSFPIDSPNWWQAFAALGCHPKETVIAYVKETAQSPVPRVRFCCYTLCRSMRWDDLREFAEIDQSNNSPVGFVPNLAPDERTIGQVARHYLNELGNQ